MANSACRLGTGILIVLALAISAKGGEAGTGAWWHDFRQAEAEAKRQGLPLLVHFYGKFCGHCVQMERDVLNDPVLLRQFRTGMIAVKVDGDVHPDLVQRFQIEAYPTDIFLDPNGYVLDRSTGGCERQTYLAMVARVESRFAQARAVRIAAQSNRSVTQSQPPARPTRLPTAPSPVASNPVASNPAALKPAAPGAAGSGLIAASIGPQAISQPSEAVPPPKSGWVTVGLRGYSPVALVANRQWVRGSRQMAWSYKGIVYYLASAEEFRRFKENPDRYAPQVMGCDPVILDITDRAVPGDIRFAAFYEGELYLFVSTKSRETFSKDPERFVRAKHVLKVDELDDKRLE